MYKAFAQRLAQLEAERRQQSAPSFVIAIVFVDRHRTPIEATFASARDFTCRRGEGETLESFQERAISECHARYPYGMPPILIFSKEPCDAARS
jgi:hypothetical protein